MRGDVYICNYPINFPPQRYVRCILSKNGFETTPENKLGVQQKSINQKHFGARAKQPDILHADEKVASALKDLKNGRTGRYSSKAGTLCRKV